MRLLYVAPEVSLPGTTGGSTHTLEVSRALARRGWEVTVVCRRDSSAQPAAETLEPGVHVHRVYRTPSLGGLLRPAAYTPVESLPRGPSKGIFSLAKSLYIRGPYTFFLSRRISRLLGGAKFDAILERGSAWGAGVGPARRHGVPAVVEVIDPEYSPGAIRRAGRVVAYTPHILPPLAGDKLVLTTAGVDPRRFDVEGGDAGERFGLPPGPFAVYVGGGEAWHGLPVLLRAMEKGEGNLVVVGVSGASTERVKFLGHIPAGMVPRILRLARLGVAPFDPRASPMTRRYGNFFSPIKLFEYMAAGLPVAASDVPLVAGVIRDAGCGVVVPPGDPEALGEAIRRLLADPEECRRMGERGRSAVRERYTWDHVAAVIDRALREAKPPAILSQKR